MFKNLAIIVCLVGLFVCAVSGAEAVQYQVVDLGAGAALGLNNCDQEVGISTGLFGSALLWQNGTATDLGFFQAHGVNDNGQVVGVDGNTNQACVWQNGVISDLSIPSGGSSAAYGINDNGSIVGYGSWKGSSTEQALLWQNGVMTDIGSGVAYAINDNGQVLLWDYDTGDDCIWQNGKIIDNLGIYVTGFGINDSGQIVGDACNPNWSFADEACLWQNGQPIFLGTLPDCTDDCATGINNNGWIVGYGWSASDYSDSYDAVLWIPVPEPSSILALLCGTGGMAGMKVRRKSIYSRADIHNSHSPKDGQRRRKRNETMSICNSDLGACCACQCFNLLGPCKCRYLPCWSTCRYDN